MFKFALSKERDVSRGILLDKKWIANKKLSDTKQFENTIKGNSIGEREQGQRKNLEEKNFNERKRVAQGRE